MKILEKKTELSTNFVSNEDNSHEFSIGDVSTIIEILRSKLYSNPIRTLTQEYLSNARDSHREANREDKPILVTLPTKIDSCLKIRDFGVGLSKDRVKEVFVNYGISTKRSDDLQTGGFGLGAKSAWAYTDSFVVVSYYNGICSTYVAHTGKNKNGTFELINETSTDEENGVEVQIPVKEEDIYKFINAVYRTTFFWETKPELRGISKIEIPSEYLKSNPLFIDNVCFVDNSDFIKTIFSAEWSNTFVLIDKISYDASKFIHDSNALRNLKSITTYNKICFINVGNGEVDVSASREEMDSNSRDKINAISNNALASVCKFVQDNFQTDFSSLEDFLENYRKMKNYFELNHLPNSKELRLSYSQNDCKFSFDLFDGCSCNDFLEISKFVIKGGYGDGDQERVSIRSQTQIPIFESTIVIEDEEFSDVLRKRKAKKLHKEGFKNIYFVKINNHSNLDFIKNSCKAKLLSSIAHDKIYSSRAKKEKGQITARYLCGDAYYGKVTVKERVNIEIESIVDSDFTYVVVPFSKDYKYDYANHEFYDFVKYFNNFKFIKCSKKDYEKITSLGADNIFTYDYVFENLEEVYEVKNEEIERYFYNNISSNLFIFRNYLEDIKCDLFKKLIEEYSSIPSEKKRPRFPEFILKKYSYFKIAKEKFSNITNMEKDIISKYPLVRKCSSYEERENIKEFIEYVNAKSSKTN